MKIPLKYNFRSLLVRWVGTLMTALGIGLPVAIFVVMMALVNGLDSTFVQTGRPDQIVAIRQGSQNEVNSFFSRTIFDAVKTLDGIAKTPSGEPAAVGEIAVIVNQPRITGETANFMIRGTSEMGFYLRPEVKITSGRMFRPGLRELVVSESLSRRFKDLRLGDKIRILQRDWVVVGTFNAGGAAYDSEAWAAYDDVALAWTRPIHSSITLRAVDQAALARLKQRIENDRRIQLQAMDEQAYFAQQTVSSVGLKALGFFIAVVMGIGSCFAAMNMMYAAVMSRSKEIGALRALGFRKRSVLASFMAESLMLALAGGLLGCLLALPMHGVSTGTINFSTFSEVLFNFKITPRILAMGLGFSLIVGLIGGILPAARASQIKLIDVLSD
jgi:putative ABC transport system permease protein